MVTFVIIRHGFSEFNKARKFTGQMDIPLDEAGFEQARETAAYVLKNYKIDAVYSSDLCRAVDTAKPIAKALSLPIKTSEKLREMNLGEWQGMGFDEVKEKYPEKFQSFLQSVKKHARSLALPACRRALSIFAHFAFICRRP